MAIGFRLDDQDNWLGWLSRLLLGWNDGMHLSVVVPEVAKRSWSRLGVGSFLQRGFRDAPRLKATNESPSRIGPAPAGGGKPSSSGSHRDLKDFCKCRSAATLLHLAIQ